MSNRSQILRCSECGVKNKVSLERKESPVCGSCKSKLFFPSSPLTITDANFQELVEKSTLPVLLDLWADWCPPCRMLAPIVDEIANELSGKAIVGKLDVDGNRITAGRFAARSIPTLLILKGGTEVDRIVGLQSKEAILSKLKRFL
ncbi:MAG: thioredoxin [Pyrinomonadaceae bacterium]|nr:thioredoxin [Pyrinomonadaceae bacterium]